MYTLTLALVSSVAKVWRSPCTRAPEARSPLMPAFLKARRIRYCRVPRVIRAPSAPRNRGAVGEKLLSAEVSGDRLRRCGKRPNKPAAIQPAALCTRRLRLVILRRCQHLSPGWVEMRPVEPVAI